MFLNKTLEQNPGLIDFTLDAHKKSMIMPDSYIVDLDQFYQNARNLLEIANKNDIKLFFMLKQIGRNPQIGIELMKMGYSGAVVVDFKEALIMIEHKIKIGNIGHLVQVPKMLLRKVLESDVEFFTVYSLEIMAAINETAKELGIVQKVMLKVIDLENDVIYASQYGGFEFKDLKEQLEAFKSFSNIEICGLTAFPCILKDPTSKQFAPTHNVTTILKAQEFLNENGFNITVLNMPSSTASYSIELIKSLGATHGEPGHGLSASTPYHLELEGPDKLSFIYLSEVSHSLANTSYCYGGGHYRRGNVTNALIDGKIVKVLPPSDESIDYYFGLEGNYTYGQTVIMNFRTQIFVTRSNVVLVEGLSKNTPVIKGVYDSQGRKI